MIFFEDFTYAAILAEAYSEAGVSHSINYGFGLYIFAFAGIVAIVGGILDLKE
jgi:hypothetical protein